MLDPGTSAASDRRSDDRLESWKAIAAYLGRDVSTVRRWERTEGLPVHRHLHAARGSAYAFKAEIDAWVESRRAAFNAPGPAESNAAGDQQPASSAQERADPIAIDTGPTHSRRRTAWVASAAALSLAMAVVVLSMRSQLVSPHGFQARDWILVGDIENRTSDPRLNDSVPFALERELSESAFVNVVSHERVVDTLRLMQKPLDSRLDRSTVLEVGVRDGNIRAVLTGRAEKFGSVVIISTVVVDPALSGDTIATATARAESDEQIPGAVRELSMRLRRALGEKWSAQQDSPSRLEHATTPSLRALKLYTEGIEAVNLRKWPVAAALLQEAVEADPDFASAEIYLAHCLRNIGRPRDDYLAHARKAAEGSARTSDRERYFILGSYYSMLGDTQQAVTAYETLVRLYPDDYWGNNNLIPLYYRLERTDEVWPLASRLFQVRPNDLDVILRVLQEGLTAGVELTQLMPIAARLERVTHPDRPADDFARAFRDLLPALQAWVASDVPETIRLVDAAATRSRHHAKMAALFNVALGRLRAAERLFEREPSVEREADLALVAFFRRDQANLARHLAAARESYGHQLALVVWLSLHANERSETERFFAEYSAQPNDGHSPTADSPWAESVRAELRLARGDARTSIAGLETGLRLVDRSRARSSRMAEALADALVRRGELARAVAVLEDASRRKAATAAPMNALSESFWGVFWLRLRAKLATIDRQLGQTSEADRIEAEVAKLLAAADPDFRLLP